jgi:hypothetical protein
MIEVREGSYTIVRFVEVGSGGKVYCGENLIDEMGISSLYGYERAMKEFEKDYRSIRFIAEDWEWMADLAFGKEWSQKSLSEIIDEAESRGLTIEVWESAGKANV